MNRNATIAAGIVVMLTVALITLHVSSRSQDDDATTIPEFFLTDMQHRHCILRVEIPGANNTQKRAALVRFLDEAYNETEGWANEFIPVSVDYVNYEYFHLVLFDACTSAAFTSAKLTLNKLSSTSVRIEIQPDNHFVISAKKRTSFETTTVFFRAYNPKQSMADCAIRLTELDKDLHNATLIHDILVKLWTKYRFSIAEIWQVNNHHYIIFSRQCSEKDILFDRLMGFSAREKTPLKGMLGELELKPDLREFFESHLE